jgi:hypothetical protein
MIVFAIVFIGLVLALVLSIRFLVAPPDRDGWLHIDMDTLAEKRGGWTVLMLYGMIAFGALMIVVSVAGDAGRLARAEMSPFPWDQFISDARRSDFWNATLDVLGLLTFHLWAFLIPAHIWATHVAKERKRRPWHPYIINILIGLLLSTPHNPIYYFLGGR